MRRQVNVTFSRRTLFLAIGILALVVIILVSSSNESSVQHVQALEARFAVLSAASSNQCGAMPDAIMGTKQGRIQGSCCSPMDFHSYQEQVEGLKKYASWEIIPEDPYDISVEHAQKLLLYQKNIQLTPEQQKVYDSAVQMSHEKGPCCCKCWHWYAYEGLAKYLITKEGFTSDQIAELWDLSDACGGKGHGHGS
ncbi:MAG TPA: hypothetical protein VJJ75_00605 [Candidatus Nanoarchaeia archaeon]|nr:hypothetical protein [Candidatus Nanoarchaeia archaeon]